MQPLFAFEHPFYPEPRRAECPTTCMRPRRPAYKDVPERVSSSNPFLFKQFRTLLRDGTPPTPFPSITSALFPMQWRGECISCPSAPHPSFAQRHRKSCVCHTSGKSSANSSICHTSRIGLPQVPCLPYLRYPPGAVYLFLPNSGRVRQPNHRKAELLVSAGVTNHESPVTAIRPIACTIARCHNWP